jgi:hypothetical protein
MTSRFLAPLTAAVALCASAASAGILTTSSQTTWNFLVGNAGLTVETETFSGIANGFYTSPFSSSTPSVAWSALASGGIVVQDGLFSTFSPEALTFNFSPGVRGVAGNFFGTDNDFNNAAVLYAVTLSDGSGYTGIATGPADFTGFWSTTAATISTIQVAVSNIAGGSDVYPTVDNLYFAVPSPGAAALVGLAGLVSRRRR